MVVVTADVAVAAAAAAVVVVVLVVQSVATEAVHEIVSSRRKSVRYDSIKH